ncbi:hypothetical protein N9X87_00110 [bacterium]|nr:hypothetical protein [bacterium]
MPRGTNRNQRQTNRGIPPITPPGVDPNAGTLLSDAKFPGQKTWLTPWRSRFAGAGGSLVSHVEQQITMTSSILDNIVPANYGENTVPGLVGHWISSSSSWRKYEIYAIAFCHGVQGGIADATFSGESSPSYLSSIEYHAGDGSTLSTHLTTDPDWTAAQTTLWKRLAHIVIKIDKSDEGFTTWPLIEAVCDGARFASFGSHTAPSEYTNCIDVAYNIHKDAIVWKGDVTDQLDTDAGGSWQDWQAWCADLVDGKERFGFTGLIYDQEAEAALARVLSICLAELVRDENSKVRVWGEKPPPRITGTWEATATNTITGSGGDAVNDLDEDDYGYWDGYYDTYGIRQVVSVAGADEWEVDGDPVTIAAGTRFFRLHHGGVYITKKDWVKLPTKADVSFAEVPDAVAVKWTRADKVGQHKQTSVFDASTTVRQQRTMAGVKTASLAERHGQTAVSVENICRFRWGDGIAGPVASLLQVGDIFLFDDGRSVMKCGRLTGPRAISYQNNTFDLPLIVQYSGEAFGDYTATEPIIEPPRGDWATEVEKLPTLVNQRIEFRGNWLRYSQMDTADDLSGWSATGLAFTYDGADNHSTLQATTTGGTIRKTWLWSDFNEIPDRMLIVFLIRTEATYVFDSNLEIDLHYSSTNYPAAEIVQWSEPFTPPDDTDHDYRLVYAAVDVDSNDDYFVLEFEVANATPHASLIDIKHMFIVPLGNNSDISIAMIFSWIEHVDALGYIKSYEIVRSGDRTPDLPAGHSVPQGSTSIEIPIISGAGLNVPSTPVAMQYYLQVLGLNGKRSTIATSSQTIADRLSYARLNAAYDVDETDIEAGRSVVIDTDGETKVPRFQTTSAPLTTYIDKVARYSEQSHHGGILALATAQPLDAVPTDLVFTTGLGRCLVVVNAGSDLAGSITVTGTSVDRDTAAETGSDTEVLTVDALTTDTSSTDAQGNTIHAFAGAYITSKLWKGSVTLSTADLTLTDVDIYQVDMESVNDQAALTLQAIKLRALATNAAAWVYGYLYSVTVASGKATVNNEATLSLVSGAATANRYYPLRRGALDVDLDGSTDGIFVDLFFGPVASTYWEDVTLKVWIDTRIRIES